MKYPVVYFEMLFVGFLLVFEYSMLRSFLPIFARELNPTGVLVGFSISSYFFARIFIELPSGFIEARIGRRIPILLGLCLSTIGTLICAFSTSIYILILGLTLWGLGTALFFTNSTALIIDLFKPHMRGRALGTFQGIELIGSFAGGLRRGVTQGRSASSAGIEPKTQHLQPLHQPGQARHHRRPVQGA